MSEITRQTAPLHSETEGAPDKQNSFREKLRVAARRLLAESGRALHSFRSVNWQRWPKFNRLQILVSWIRSHRRECAAVVIIVMMVSVIPGRSPDSSEKNTLPEAEYSDVEQILDDFRPSDSNDLASVSLTESAVRETESNLHTKAAVRQLPLRNRATFGNSSLTRVIPEGEAAGGPSLTEVKEVSESRMDAAPQTHVQDNFSTQTIAAPPAPPFVDVRPAEKTAAMRAIRFRGQIQPLSGQTP